MSEPVACARHTETEALLDIILHEHGGLTALPARAGTKQTFIGILPATVIDPAIAGTWRHFKGGVYEFVTRPSPMSARQMDASPSTSEWHVLERPRLGHAALAAGSSAQTASARAVLRVLPG